jgi:hypothetical protein
MLPAHAATIPVPPPVQGGWRGTLFSTVALAIEVLLALARGLGGWFAAAFGLRRARTVGGGFVRGTLRVMAGTAKLILFLLVLLLLGGLTTYITVQFLRASG